MGLASRILIGGELAESTLKEARVSTFVEVRHQSNQYSSFAWRLVLSSVIATGGIAAGSTAVVIGAMLIAPLMSPMLGTALSIVEGDAKGIAKTLIITIAGVMGSIFIAALVAAAIPVHIDTSTNSEVLSRVSPRLVDLIVALAAGMIAALALMRKDIPDAIPGVAISASIVPPLCVAGVSVYSGDLVAAFGSMMLFMANYFGIQVVSIAIFLAIGIGREQGKARIDKARMAWYISAIVGLVAVGSVLGFTSYSMVQDASDEKQIATITKQWLEGTDYSLYSFDYRNKELRLEIAGSGEAPIVDDLNVMLQEKSMEVDTIKTVVLYEVISTSS